MHRNESASKLCYVKGLHASLYFLLDGHIGTLNASGDEMTLLPAKARKGSRMILQSCSRAGMY